MQEINEQFHEELKKMHRKITCVDCNSPHAHWATLRRGFFICTRCAQGMKSPEPPKNLSGGVWGGAAPRKID